MKSFGLALLAALTALTALPAGAAPGPGDLLVAPTRVVLEGRERNAQLTLVNTGDRAATYRISFVELRMDENGATREIAEGDAAPGEKSAAPLVRFFPRQVTLEPSVAQMVRLQLRLPEGLEPGEYRSHLLLRAIPEADEPAAEPGAAGLQLSLQAVFGISIPVIVRHGETAADARLADLRLEREGAQTRLAFRLERSGNRSLFGDLQASFQPAGGKPAEAARVGGVAVYSPNPFRHGRLALAIPPAQLAAGGKLRLVYRNPGREVLAEAELVLP